MPKGGIGCLCTLYSYTERRTQVQSSPSSQPVSSHFNSVPTTPLNLKSDRMLDPRDFQTKDPRNLLDLVGNVTHPERAMRSRTLNTQRLPKSDTPKPNPNPIFVGASSKDQARNALTL